ncbi:MAG: alpha/beta hydrolase-fold protein [Alphaproteobacteria bacterium]
MHRDPRVASGRVIRETIETRVLEGNMLGDPTRRSVDIYIPADHDGRSLPLLVDLVGFTGGGPAHTNWRNFTENVPERADRLIASGEMAPCVIAFPDCFTRLGGNQYINSVAVGRWDDFLLQEAVPFVEQMLGCGGPGKRGVFGKSSGGYGAIVHALLHPDFWSAAACHSGDMGWELLQIPDFPRALKTLATEKNDIKAWLEKFWTKPKVSDNEVHVLMTLCMCAEYDPDPTAFMGVRMPVDLETCELIPERWANWMKWDPLTIAETRAEDLKRLKGLFIDCGDIDQYNLVYGARRMHRLLERAGVKHTYEEFSDDHSGVDYRMDRSLPFLAEVLSK